MFSEGEKACSCILKIWSFWGKWRLNWPESPGRISRSLWDWGSCIYNDSNLLSCVAFITGAPLSGLGIKKAGGWVYSEYSCHLTGATTTKNEGELFWNWSLLLPQLRIMVSLSELQPAPLHLIPAVTPSPIPPLDPVLERALGKSKLKHIFPCLQLPGGTPLHGEHFFRSANRLWPFRVYSSLPLPDAAHQLPGTQCSASPSSSLTCLVI